MLIHGGFLRVERLEGILDGRVLFKQAFRGLVQRHAQLLDLYRTMIYRNLCAVFIMQLPGKSRRIPQHPLREPSARLRCPPLKTVWLLRHRSH